MLPAREHLAPEVQVRLDVGFTDGAFLAALDAAQIPFVGRLRENPALTRLCLIRTGCETPVGRPCNPGSRWSRPTTKPAPGIYRADC